MEQQTKPQAYFEPDEQPFFSHKPLPTTGKEIRLLNIGPGQYNDPLQGYLSVQSLDLVVDFEALSYVWGPSDPKQLLLLDDQEFYIRSNIHSFLRRLRDPHRPRKLWLDAVCIDQNNINERSHQVSLMRDIYRSCRQCVVWLGDASNRNDEVLELFSENPVDEEGMQDLNNLVRLLYARNLVDAFRAVLTNPYWTRVWMIQETTLPARVVVYCGQSSCLLDTIPTQVRASMFDVFQNHRRQYQTWLEIFKHVESPTLTHITPSSVENLAEGRGLFPVTMGSTTGPYLLAFCKSSNKERWEPLIMEREDASIRIIGTVSLSTISPLSFSVDDFDAVRAFHAIQSAFWCMDQSTSEQLLDERRRHITANSRDFSSVDFRNYLESSDRWHCTDVRDRVFGVLGVFEKWPQTRPYQANYSLNSSEILIPVVDYCRPTDPFKLAIKLLSTLEVMIPEPSLSVESPTITLMSRIAWPLQTFSVVRYLDGKHASYSISRLRRLKDPHSAHFFHYVPHCEDPPRQSDELISIGDAGVLLGIRRSEFQGDWTAVGIAFDAGVATDQGEVDADVVEIFMDATRQSRGSPAKRSSAKRSSAKRSCSTEHDPHGPVPRANCKSSNQKELDMPAIRIDKADPWDQSDDGTPVLWWLQMPSQLFWCICRYEKQRRSPAHHDFRPNDNEDEDLEHESAIAVDGDEFSSRNSLVFSDD
jgi:hypothetical protein